MPGGPPAAAGWLPVALVLAAAVARRAPPSPGARGAVGGIPALGRRAADARCWSSPGSSAVRCCSGSPRSAQALDCKESPEPDRPGTGLVGSLDPPTPGRRVSRAASTTRSATPGWSGTTTTSAAPAAAFNPADHHRHLAGQPDPQRREVRRRRGQLVALPHRRRRRAARPAGRADRRRHPGDVRRRVHHLDRAGAAAARRSCCSCSRMRGDLARQTQRAAFAVVALVVGSAAYLAPVDWAKAADRSAARRRHPDAGGLPRPGRPRQPRHAADRAGRPGRLPELAARRVRLARRAAGPAAGPRPAARADVHQGRGRRAPGHAGAGRAEEGRLRRDRRPAWATATPTSRASPAAGSAPASSPSSRPLCIALFQLLSKVLVLVAMLVLRLMVMTAPADRRGRDPQAGHPAGAAARRGCGHRQHARRRGAGRPARAAGRLAVPARFRASTCGSRCWSPAWSPWCCGRWRGRSGGWCRWSR